MKDARLLVRALVDPDSTDGLDAEGWTILIACARAESLIGSLAHRLDGRALPEAVAAIMADARRSAAQAKVQALWEAEMARRALAELAVPVILLKGTAYAAAGLDAAIGRSIGDLDILVPRDVLDRVEAALLAAGWEWVKDSPYDQLYYRRWMHELPPLIHRDRDRMIDVHHSILPLTARPTPDAAALIADSVPLESGLRILSPPDMIVHAAAHLLADGDLAGGLRNLWDIDRLVRQHDGGAFRDMLQQRAQHHGLASHVGRALRLAHSLYETPVDPRFATPTSIADRLYENRLLARDGWGRECKKLLRFAFYVRSHWIRMPPRLLARHLWVKIKARA
jgi:hypothetical protein